MKEVFVLKQRYGDTDEIVAAGPTINRMKLRAEVRNHGKELAWTHHNSHGEWWESSDGRFIIEEVPFYP